MGELIKIFVVDTPSGLVPGFPTCKGHQRFHVVRVVMVGGLKPPAPTAHPTAHCSSPHAHQTLIPLATMPSRCTVLALAALAMGFAIALALAVMVMPFHDNDMTTEEEMWLLYERWLVRYIDHNLMVGRDDIDTQRFHIFKDNVRRAFLLQQEGLSPARH